MSPLNASLCSPSCVVCMLTKFVVRCAKYRSPSPRLKLKPALLLQLHLHRAPALNRPRVDVLHTQWKHMGSVTREHTRQSRNAACRYTDDDAVAAD